MYLGGALGVSFHVLYALWFELGTPHFSAGLLQTELLPPQAVLFCSKLLKENHKGFSMLILMNVKIREESQSIGL